MLEVTFVEQKTWFAPSEMIRGSVSWSGLDETEEQLAVRLIWYTSGKGTRDYRTVDSIDFELPAKQNRIEFEFLARRRPLSFSGHLISLQWAVEAVAFPSKDSARREFELTAGGGALLLEDRSPQLKELGIKKPFLRMS